VKVVTRPKRKTMRAGKETFWGLEKIFFLLVSIKGFLALVSPLRIVGWRRFFNNLRAAR
jgi:hypothetical protein